MRHPLETPRNINTVWSIDTLDVGTSASGTNYRYAQVVIDHMSRYAWAVATKTNKWDDAYKAFDLAVKSGDAPERLMADNGPNLASARFKSAVESHGTRLVHVSAYRPEANGVSERLNRELVTNMRRAMLDRPKICWRTALKVAIDAYNNSPHSATGYTPIAIHFGIGLPDTKRLSDIRNEAAQRSLNTQRRRTNKHNDGRQLSDYPDGSLVLVRVPSNHPKSRKFTPPYDGPFAIVKRVADDSYKVERQPSPYPKQKAIEIEILPNSFTVNADRMKPYQARSERFSKSVDSVHTAADNVALQRTLSFGAGECGGSHV